MRGFIKILFLAAMVFGVVVFIRNHFDGVFRQLVDEAFPQKTVENLVTEALSDQAASLKGMENPAIFSTIKKADLDTLANKVLEEAIVEIPPGLKVSNLEVSTDRQLLVAELTVTGLLPETKTGFQATMRAAARIGIRLEESSSGGTQPVIMAALAFDEIRVDQLDLGWNPFGTQEIAANLIDSLTTFKDNINGAIPPFEAPLDVKPLRIEGSPEIAMPVAVGSVIIEILPPVFLGAAYLADDQGLHVLVDLGIEDWSGFTQHSLDLSDAPSFSEYQNAFRSIATERFGVAVSDMDRSRVVVAEGIFEAQLAATMPSVNFDDIQSSAIDAGLTQLAAIRGPDLAFYIPGQVLLDLLEKKIGEQLQDLPEGVAIELQELSLGQQSLSVSVTFKGVHQDKDASVEIEGDATVSLVPSSNEEGILLRPVLRAISIKNVVIPTGGVDFLGIPALATRVLSESIGTINAQLQLDPIAIPTVNFETIDLQTEQLTAAGLKTTPATWEPFEVEFGAIAIRLSDDGLSVLADLEAPELPIRAALTVPDIDGFGEIFEHYQSIHFDPPGTFVVAGVSRERIGHVATTVWNRIGLSVTFSDVVSDSTFARTGVELVNDPSYKCEGIECSRRSCMRDRCPPISSCDRAPGECLLDKCSYDTSHCRRRSCNESCIREIRIGGRVVGKGDDPFCLARKAKCNIAADLSYGKCKLKANADKAACDVAATTKKTECNARVELRVADCKRLNVGCNIAADGKSTTCNAQADINYGACQVVSATDASLCNAGRELHQMIASNSKVAEFDGNLRALATGAIELGSLDVADDLSHLTLKPTFGARIKLDGLVNWYPRDLGYAICHADVGIDFHSEVQLPVQSPTIIASLKTEVSEDQSVDIIIHVEEIPIVATLDDFPARVILRDNPELLLKCNPIFQGALSALVLLGEMTALAPDDLVRGMPDKSKALLFGEIAYDLKTTDYRVPISIAPINLQGLIINPEVTLTEKAVRAKFSIDGQ